MPCFMALKCCTSRMDKLRLLHVKYIVLVGNHIVEGGEKRATKQGIATDFKTI